MKTNKLETLKVGMVVENKSGVKRMVMSMPNGHLYLMGLNDVTYIRSVYSYRYYSKVYKVVKPVSLKEILQGDGSCLELIWERPTKTLLTKAMIAEKFGLDVEQLEIIS